MILQSEAHVLRARVNTWLGSLLLMSVALWAGITIWQTATGTNPLAKAFISAYERSQVQ